MRLKCFLCLVAAASAAAAVLAGGCKMEDINPVRQPRRELDLTPRAEVDKLTINTEPVASDSDKDGVPDTVVVTCNLFVVSGQGTWSVLGKGNFRFEVYDGSAPAETRQPISQLNVNYEQSKKYAVRSHYGMISYVFPVPLGRIPQGLKCVMIIGRFFPEVGEEVQSNSPAVLVPGFVIAHPPPPASQPER